MKLPKYFVIERCEDPRRQKYIDWLNEKYGKIFTGSYKFYGFDGSHEWGGVDFFLSISNFQNNPTLITLDQREEATQEWKPKRGDVVLVSNAGEARKERIYITTIEGALYPFACVSGGQEKNYKKDSLFYSSSRKQMKSLPKETKPKKKISDLGDNDVIRCKTKKRDKKIRKLLHKTGKKWKSGTGFLYESNWDNNGDQHCIRPSGERSSKEYYKNKGYAIHKAKDFY